MTWLKNFKPHMVVYTEYHTGLYEDVYIAEAVCANRVFRVRNAVALRACKTEKERRFIRYGRWNETGTAYS